MSKNNVNMELRQFNAVSIKQLHEICNNIKSSVHDISTITSKVSKDDIMYAAGVHYALNRLLSIIDTSLVSNKKGNNNGIFEKSI